MANANLSLDGGGCPDGDCGDKQSKKNPLSNAISSVKCHHTASVPEGNRKGLNGLFKSRQSGYIQYGGSMPPLSRDCISNPQLIVNKNRKALLDKALRFYCDHLNW